MDRFSVELIIIWCLKVGKNQPLTIDRRRLQVGIHVGGLRNQSNMASGMWRTWPSEDLHVEILEIAKWRKESTSYKFKLSGLKLQNVHPLILLSLKVIYHGRKDINLYPSILEILSISILITNTINSNFKMRLDSKLIYLFKLKYIWKFRV